MLIRKMMGHKVKQNYQLYRIRDLIHRQTIGNGTKYMLNMRLLKLGELGAKAINNIVN